MIASLVLPSILSFVPTWLVARYLKENAPDMGAFNAWLVGSVMGSLAGTLVWYVVDFAWDAAAAHPRAVGASLVLLGSCSGAFVLVLASPSLRTWVDAFPGGRHAAPVRAAPLARRPPGSPRPSRRDAPPGPGNR